MPTDCVKTFQKAVDAFNNARSSSKGYESLRPFLYKTITMERVNDQWPVNGTTPDLIIKYLKDTQTTHWPKLNLTSDVQESTSSDGTESYLTGSADYIDDSLVQPDGRQPVTYHFVLILDSSSHRWQICYAGAH